MGRSPCCDKVGLKKGPWTPEEDQKLLAYIEEHGHGSWRALPTKAGLQRCGKSCRLRWTNYLRPDIKRGKFNIQEEQTIIQLHALLGNRWSAIATHLPKRTDNEIKNYWNTHLKKRLAKMGIDPVTHKPKSDALVLSNDGHNKHAANLSHMAQWESARLEAEARLVRQSKLRSNSFHQNPLPPAAAASASPDFSSPSSPRLVPPPPPRCLDILKAWNGVWSSSTSTTPNPNINEATASASAAAVSVGGLGGDLESPTSTLSYSENAPSSGINNNNNNGDNSTAFIEFVGNNSSGSCEGGGGIMKEEGHEEDWKGFGSSNNLADYNNDDGIINIENSMSSFNTSVAAGGLHDLTAVVPMDTCSDDDEDNDEDNDDDNVVPFVERFTDLLLSTATGTTTTTTTTTTDHNLRSFSEGCGDSSDHNKNNNNNGGVSTCNVGNCSTTEYLEDNKNYWNSILNLVNSSSPSDSAMF